jgi:small subunit ribosomal protein S14
MEERFKATLKLAELPRNGSKTRVRNVAKSPAVRAPSTASSRCRVSRCVELGNQGQIPGLVKSSW